MKTFTAFKVNDKSFQTWFVQPIVGCSLMAVRVSKKQSSFENPSLWQNWSRFHCYHFFHIHWEEKKCQTKRRFRRRQSGSWSTWKNRSKAQYILKEMPFYWVCRNRRVSSKEMNALLVLTSSKIQFTGQIVIKYYWIHTTARNKARKLRVTSPAGCKLIYLQFVGELNPRCESRLPEPAGIFACDCEYSWVHLQVFCLSLRVILLEIAGFCLRIACIFACKSRPFCMSDAGKFAWVPHVKSPAKHMLYSGKFACGCRQFACLLRELLAA